MYLLGYLDVPLGSLVDNFRPNFQNQRGRVDNRETSSIGMRKGFRVVGTFDRPAQKMVIFRKVPVKISIGARLSSMS
jgi:hypothetical protein